MAEVDFRDDSLQACNLPFDVKHLNESDLFGFAQC